MADDNKIQFDVELNEGSVESSFKSVDERAVKSAKSSAAVFGEHFQKLENDLKDSIDRIVKTTGKVAEKSAKESAAVFNEAFRKQDEIYKASVKWSLDKAIEAITNSDSMKKSAKKSAEVFEEAFRTGVLQDPLDIPVEVPSSLFDIKGLADLAGGFYLLKNAAYAAGESVKATLDFLINGENELKIDKKFRILAEQAGLAANNIEDRLVKSVKDLVDEGELLAFASESFVKIGNNAKELPQILELSRKAYEVFGGSVLENAEKINQAIFTGNTRQLRNLGILIDSDQVLKAYARTLGTVVPLLSEQQRQSAILNEVLRQGEIRFKNVVAGQGDLTLAIERFSIKTKELKDELSILVSSTIGGRLSKFIDNATESLKDWIRVVNLARIDKMPEGIDKINFAIKTLSESIAEGEKKLASYGKTEMRVMGATLKEGIDRKKAELEGYKKKLEEITQTQNKLGETSVSGSISAPPSEEFIRRSEALAAKVQELNSQVAASEVQLAQEKLARLRNYKNLETLTQTQILNEVSNFNQQRANLEKFYADNGIIDDMLRKQGREALESQHVNRMLAIQQQYEEQKKNIFIEGETRALTGAEAINEIMQGMEDQARKTSVNAARSFRSLGGSMLQGVGQAAGQAFAAFGKAIAEGENALEAFGKALLNSLGQMAIQVGTELILMGIGYSYAGLANGPPLIAAGAALAAFGGVLSVVGGVGPSGLIGGGGGGISSGDIDSQGDINGPINVEDTVAQIPKTEISINVSGNILDRRETGLEIAQILEEQFAEQGLVLKGA